MTISNTLTNSRREAAFIKRIPLTDNQRLTYIKQAIAGAHSDMLKEVIRFTHIEKDRRRFDFEIIIANTCVSKGCIHQSYNQASRWMSTDKRVHKRYIKSIIAATNKQLLHPYIHVDLDTIKSSYREIPYTIDPL